MTGRIAMTTVAVGTAAILALGTPRLFAVEPGATLSDPVLARWTAAVWYDGRHQCTASLIDRAWVLTARHCVDKFCAPDADPGILTVWIGSTRIEGKPFHAKLFEVREVSCPTPQPAAKGVRWSDDVALVRIGKKFGKDKHRPTVNGCPGTGSPLVAVGWMKASDGGQTRRETAATVELVPLPSGQCAELLSNPATCPEMLALGPGQFCARSANPKPGTYHGLQEGDSGGPLVLMGGTRPQVVGVASAACSGTGITIFEDVSRYRGWIVEEVCGYYAESWGAKAEANCKERLLGP